MLSKEARINPEEAVEAQGEVLFTDGPTVNQIEAWKSQYGNVYMSEIEDDIFIWRAITRLEYKNILKAKQGDALYREERMCEMCVLFPADFNFTLMNVGRAGIPTVLAEQIMEKSGFTPTETVKKL